MNSLRLPSASLKFHLVNNYRLDSFFLSIKVFCMSKVIQGFYLSVKVSIRSLYYVNSSKRGSAPRASSASSLMT